MTEQLTFSRILAEADELARTALDRHRHRVQTWFDELPASDKNRLAEWMATLEWDTWVAFSAAAGDWYQSRHATNGK